MPAASGKFVGTIGSDAVLRAAILDCLLTLSLDKALANGSVKRENSDLSELTPFNIVLASAATSGEADRSRALSLEKALASDSVKLEISDFSGV